MRSGCRLNSPITSALDHSEVDLANCPSDEQVADIIRKHLEEATRWAKGKH